MMLSEDVCIISQTFVQRPKYKLKKWEQGSTKH